MAEESKAKVELEQRIESIMERVLEHHLQHLLQANTEAGEPSKRASGLLYQSPVPVTPLYQSPVWDDESPSGTHQRNRYGH